MKITIELDTSDLDTGSSTNRALVERVLAAFAPHAPTRPAAVDVAQTIGAASAVDSADAPRTRRVTKGSPVTVTDLQGDKTYTMQTTELEKPNLADALVPSSPETVTTDTDDVLVTTLVEPTPEPEPAPPTTPVEAVQDHGISKENMISLLGRFVAHPHCGGPRALAGVIGRYGDADVPKPTSLSGPTAIPVSRYPALRDELEKLMRVAQPF